MQTNPFTEIQQQLAEIQATNKEILLAIGKREMATTEAELLNALPDRLRSRDIKKLFDISSVTIWQWAKKGLLTPQVINGRNYFAKSDVLKLLGEKSTRKGVKAL